MIQKAIETLRCAAEEGVRTVNESIDNVLFSDPYEEAEREAYYLAEEEIDRENSRVDRANAKIDAEAEKARGKVQAFNESFDRGVQKAKDTYREFRNSPLGQMYRAARAVKWGTMGLDYLSRHPEILESAKQAAANAGRAVAEAVQGLDFTGYADEETARICARRDMLFGAADAGVEGVGLSDTELLLQGISAPAVEMGLEMAL